MHTHIYWIYKKQKVKIHDTQYINIVLYRALFQNKKYNAIGIIYYSVIYSLHQTKKKKF